MEKRQTLGLYLHVPFCVSKCPYCDFYSLPHSGWDEELLERYTGVLCESLSRWAERLPGQRADTLYFGGGTPSLLGGKRLTRLIQAADAAFSLFTGETPPEITLEANPGDELADTLRAFAAAGGNRVSLGMQAADREGLKALGRRHTPDQTGRAAAAVQAAGIDNLSLDLMLATPGQTVVSLAGSVRTAARLGARHLSAYLLRLEEGTPYFDRRDRLALPDEDEAAAQYERVCDLLEQYGYRQYEISSFALPDCESRHNLKYWRGEAYLGLGPAAHSFVDGRRFAYPRDLKAFLAGGEPAAEENGEETLAENSEEEYLMLRLRLTVGVSEEDFAARFGHSLPTLWRERAEALPKELIVSDAAGIRLTRQGFLLSNALIGRLLGF